MPVEMKLSRIIRSDILDHQVICLRECGGERQFPIMIGPFEAMSIERRVTKAERPERPQTHDLLVGVAEALGGEFDSVVINDLRDGTYFARLRIRVNGELVEIDSRPSDAIAVAVTFDPHLPIYVAEDVLEEAAK